MYGWGCDWIWLGVRLDVLDVWGLTGCMAGCMAGCVSVTGCMAGVCGMYGWGCD